MKAGIMQPYFFPYIGYFQLMASVDLFILYDNIKYTKKGWINRNRMLQNGKDVVFSLPLKSAPDTQDICERELAADFKRDRLLNQFKEAYRRAPYFAQTYPLLERIVNFDDANLFRYLHHSLIQTRAYLGINTKIIVSSSISIDHGLKGQAKVLALCTALGATTYVNAIGGMELYASRDFRDKGIALRFIKSRPFEYPQFGDTFVPWLSIVDVLMFNSIQKTRECLGSGYDLIENAAND